MTEQPESNFNLINSDKESAIKSYFKIKKSKLHIYAFS